MTKLNLDLYSGEIAIVVLMSHDGWWYITVGGKKGLGPAQFLTKVLL